MSTSDRDLTAALTADGWIREDEGYGFVRWWKADVSSPVSESTAERILDGMLCPAVLCHGPGHQSKTHCERTGEHDVHTCTYGEFDQEAEWRTGAYTASLRARGIEVETRSYPATMSMSGFFDEGPVAD